MTNRTLDWSIIGYWDDFVLEEYERLFYKKNWTIKDLDNSILSQKQINGKYATITRSDICKIYTLCGVLKDNLFICMKNLEIQLMDRILNNNLFLKFEFLPDLLSFSLKNCIFNDCEESEKDILIEKIYTLIKNTLLYLYFNNKSAWIILIAGTSGSGKSTISSCLASYLKIKYILSTDTIRHILCSTENYKDMKTLHCSTYEVHNYTQELSNRKGENKNDIILGYLLQSSIIEDFIYKMIKNVIIKENSIIVEGVHLTPILFERIKNLSLEQGVKFSAFLIYIKDSHEHIKRFQQRSKGILNSKYFNNICGIREIQDYLLSSLGKESDVICIDNTSNNIDYVVEEHVLRYISQLLI